MNPEGFDPQRWDHGLVMIVFMALASRIIWKVYLDQYLPTRR
jgi:hypothetical protein